MTRIYAALLLAALAPVAPRASAADPKKPIEFNTTYLNIGPNDGHWAKAHGQLSRHKNTLYLTLEAESHSTKGFHAAAVCDLLDEHGNILAQVATRSVGVNGTILAGSTRHVIFTKTFDPSKPDEAEVLSKVVKIRPRACYGDPADFLKQLKGIAKDAYGVYEAIQGKEDDQGKDGKKDK